MVSPIKLYLISKHESISLAMNVGRSGTMQRWRLQMHEIRIANCLKQCLEGMDLDDPFTIYNIVVIWHVQREKTTKKSSLAIVGED